MGQCWCPETCLAWHFFQRTSFLAFWPLHFPAWPWHGSGVGSSDSPGGSSDQGLRRDCSLQRQPGFLGSSLAASSWGWHQSSTAKSFHIGHWDWAQSSQLLMVTLQPEQSLPLSFSCFQLPVLQGWEESSIPFPAQACPSLPSLTVRSLAPNTAQLLSRTNDP